MYNARMNLLLVALILLTTMCTIQEAHIIPDNESVVQEEHVVSADQNAVQEKHVNPENESTTHDEKIIQRSGTIIKRIFRVFSKDPKKRYQGAQRLCSSKLSDALSVVCYGRGYNSPFSGNVETRRNGDPGIVEECCHEGCNYQQLERYCNPIKEVQDEEDEDYGHESEETRFPDVAILKIRPRRMKSVTRCKNSAKSVTPRNMPGQSMETDNSDCIIIQFETNSTQD